ncbi:recombinase family protein [[Clostridium] innocuum]|nr:recombinase family protein [[Clostridium] innocuum]
MRKTYGYVRVSSQDQNEARQYLELLDMGIEKKYIYMDKLSGKDFNRPAYHKLVYKKLKQGELQSKEAIAISGLKYSTFYKKVKELEDGKINSDTL